MGELVRCGSVNWDVPAVRVLVLRGVQLGAGLASTTTAALVGQEMRKPKQLAAAPKQQGMDRGKAVGAWVRCSKNWVGGRSFHPLMNDR